MQLYFIRHGQSTNNAGWGDPNYIESSDPKLTENGKEQINLLADFLNKNQVIKNHNGWDVHNRYGFGITHIYTSLMERAAHSAAPSVRKLPHIPFTAWIEIHESGGIYDRNEKTKHASLPGRPRSFFETNFPELTLPKGLNESGWWNRPLETEDECQLRAQHVWTNLLSRHGDQDGRPEHSVAFVSHGGFFMHLMCAILDLPWRSASNGLTSWFLLNNCSISRISVRKGEVTICYINRTDHLPDHLIT